MCFCKGPWFLPRRTSWPKGIFSTELNRPARRESYTLSFRFFSKPRFPWKETFGRLKSQFKKLPAVAFWLRYDHQVSRKSGRKNRHRYTSITAPAGRLTLLFLKPLTIPQIGRRRLQLVTFNINFCHVRPKTCFLYNFWRRRALFDTFPSACYSKVKIWKIWELFQGQLTLSWFASFASVFAFQMKWKN